jgi:hypothetical protein
MENMWEQSKKVFDTLRHLDIPSVYSVEVIDNYIKGLFSYSKFKIGDAVEMADTYPVSKEESWGWWGYRHLLVRGSKAIVENVDWQKGEFIYYVKFLDNSYIDSRSGSIHPVSTSELGVFCLSEKWLTEKVLVE